VRIGIVLSAQLTIDPTCGREQRGRESTPPRPLQTEIPIPLRRLFPGRMDSQSGRIADGPTPFVGCSTCGITEWILLVDRPDFCKRVSEPSTTSGCDGRSPSRRSCRHATSPTPKCIRSPRSMTSARCERMLGFLAMPRASSSRNRLLSFGKCLCPHRSPVGPLAVECKSAVITSETPCARLPGLCCCR